MRRRDKNKFKILAEIRRMITEAARCKIIILRKNLGEPGKPDDNLMPGWVRVPMAQIVQRPFVKELWVAVRSSEDREEWMV